jgi:hypothetical protein
MIPVSKWQGSMQTAFSEARSWQKTNSSRLARAVLVSAGFVQGESQAKLSVIFGWDIHDKVCIQHVKTELDRCTPMNFSFQIRRMVFQFFPCIDVRIHRY